MCVCHSVCMFQLILCTPNMQLVVQLFTNSPVLVSLPLSPHTSIVVAVIFSQLCPGVITYVIYIQQLCTYMYHCYFDWYSLGDPVKYLFSSTALFFVFLEEDNLVNKCLKYRGAIKIQIVVVWWDGMLTCVMMCCRSVSVYFT